MVCNGIGELTLVAEDKDAVEQVDNQNKSVGTKQTLTEFFRTRHFAHDLAEDRSTTPSKDHLINTLNTVVKSVTGNSVNLDWSLGDLTRGPRNLIVRATRGRTDHRNNTDGDVHPNSAVSQVTEILKRTNLANDHTEQSPYENLDSETELRILGSGLNTLRKGLASRQHNDTDVQDHLNELQASNEEAAPRADDTSGQISECSKGEIVRIQAAEDPVE